MTDDQPDRPVTLSYAQGGYEKWPRTLGLLRIFDVVVGAFVIFINVQIFADVRRTLFSPPAPPPAVDPDGDHTTTARWQYWTVLIDAAISVALALLLFLAAWLMGRPRSERLADRLHWFYVWAKLILVLAVASLYGWDVDRGRMEWGLFARTFMLGALHPLMVIGLLVQIGKQMQASSPQRGGRV